jgi:hypothetical protein
VELLQLYSAVDATNARNAVFQKNVAMHREIEMKSTKLSTNVVADRLKEAAETLRRLPKEKISSLKSNWPETIPTWGDYGDEKARVRLGPPSPDTIDRMDEALGWMRWLEPDETKLAWAVACGVNRKLIGAKFGIHRGTVWREWKAIIRKLTALINVREEMAMG